MKNQRQPHNRESLPSHLYLTDEEYVMLLSNLEQIRSISPRNAALIYTALYTGARAQEVLNIRVKDIDRKAQTILIRGLKKSFDRELPMHPWLLDLLLSLVEDHKQVYIFKIKYCQFRNIWYQVSPVKKKLHCLRHTRAMRALSIGGDPSVVKTGLGHKSFKSTQVYLNHQATTERLKKFLE